MLRSWKSPLCGRQGLGLGCEGLFFFLYILLSHVSIAYWTFISVITLALLFQIAKGLSKDEKAQKLALQHWLEAIDPRHRYRHNLLMYYYYLWFESQSSQLSSTG
ncbi:hypothetical protein RchiOBHm_Chr5g0053561 [Rosa chinensis]|uniref:Uncharacterized protein n=1 Tax=Rosa chinensis TaxID=74649 RepID=A0A2P6QFX5_ROSCH|nr:hypothetical protein RchiOBHm_Chr5g0053561 [Rosa chinensis]